MINMSRPNRVLLIESSNIMEEILSPLAQRRGFESGSSQVIPVYCYRLAGISANSEDFYERLAELDSTLEGLGDLYLKCTGPLEIISNEQVASKINGIWMDHFAKDGGIEKFFNACSISELFPEIAKIPVSNIDQVISEVINFYKSMSPNLSPTILKNFCIKMICWVGKYAIPLFRPFESHGKIFNPKVMFYGNIKEHEVHFLILLSKLGADVLYINTVSDGKFGEIDKKNMYSRLTKLEKTEDMREFPKRVQKVQESNVSVQGNLQGNTGTINNRIPTINASVNTTVNSVNPSELKREKSFEELASLAPYVVKILSFNEDGEVLRGGSGVIIGSNGLIATNYHVLEGTSYFGILFEGSNEEYIYETYTIVNANVQKDIALIKLNIKTTPMKISNSGDLVRGQKIVTIGSPFGLMNTFSDGIVSGFRKHSRFDFIQITAPFSEGSSGGAMLNLYGELVGITTTYYYEGQNLSLAVPIKYVVELLENKFTALNMEIMDKYNTFVFENIKLEFDGFFSYLSTERDYKISLLRSRYDKLDISRYQQDGRFVRALEQFFTDNIINTAVKYNIEKFEFEICFENMYFTYLYDKGCIVNKSWRNRFILGSDK